MSTKSHDLTPQHPSLVEALRKHAINRADKVALIMLADGETEQARLTYAELDRSAKNLAARMQREGLSGERVVIMLHTSVEYVIAFLACLYAGAIAVPLSPPTKSAHLERVDHVVLDCEPALAIISEGADLMTHLPEQHGCAVWSAESLSDPADHEWQPPTSRPGNAGYLQYTSGSTSMGRGVVVTHDNLMHQLKLLSAGLSLDGDDTVVSWLPLFHDFGLVAGWLAPLVLGGTAVKMPPEIFAQRPLRWLSAISRYRATISFSPNFPLDLCCERITETQKQDLDLSSWRVLGLGAEPIRPDTLDRFADRFRACGFRHSTYRVVYGMAESTLLTTIQPEQDRCRVLTADAEALTHGVVEVVPENAADPTQRRLISNGTVRSDTQLLIVDPQTRVPLEDGREGEVWMRGRTVSPGYWNRPRETDETFGGRLSNGSGPYLRSGDLGTLIDGELYLTSRIKDLIIIRGRNHHPQDIELTLTDAHPALKRGLGVAFSVDDGNEERLVVVQEIKRAERGRHDLEEVAERVRGAVAEAHDISIHTLVLLPPATLPKTTSGKIRRRHTKDLFLRGQLDAEHVSGPSTPCAPAETVTLRDVDDVTRWLQTAVGNVTGRPPRRVAVDVTFGNLGLDSAAVLSLTGEMAAWLGRPVEPTLVYRHPTIARLTAAVTGSLPAATRSRATRASSALDRGSIAVIGMACALPGASSIDEFWSLLSRGEDAITPPPQHRREGSSHRERPPTAGHDPTTWGGFLPDVTGFDARFFGVSAEEAAMMDPQQRLLLTTTWRALEDAGVPAEKIAGAACGVFVGITNSDYRNLMIRDHVEPGPYTGTGTSLSVAAGRISYFFDLAGPSMSVDTACSSSLVAVHHACESLRRGECDTAIVGGVNLLLDPSLTVGFAKAGMLSSTGRCRTFDHMADGYVRGEGCGVVVLKRQADAERDNDRAYALIAGSAVNQDGHSSTLTAPNVLAQQAVMHAALEAAALTPDRIGYVEAHGTGTSLGDPIEMSGIAEVYGAANAEQPLWVGSVKTNIGHLESAAGIAGLIKAVLALDHERIPANLHLDRVNPLIHLEDARCRVPTEHQPWARTPGRPRAAAVSSFGFSGTNAHVIIQESAIPPEPGVTKDIGDIGTWQVLPISAKSRRALDELTDSVTDALDAPDRAPQPSFADLCRAAAHRRSQLPHRVSVVARSAKEAADVLREHRAGRRSAYVLTGAASESARQRTTWLFPGQGFQRTAMAAPFHERHEVFRSAIAECDAIIKPELGVSLLPTLVHATGELVNLDETRFGQPAMFAAQYALARVWQECGATPDYLLGHSLGEYTAACLAGALSLEDAVGLVLLRSRLMHESPPGAMYAVHTAHLEDMTRELAESDSDVVVAAVNGPEDVTISGPEAATTQVATTWARRGAKVTRLGVSRAFHSPLMESAIEPFARAARSVRHSPARTPVVSTLTGEVLTTAELTGEHWVRQLREPVLFAAALSAVERRGGRHFVEMSPEPVLSPLGPRTVSGATWLVSGHRRDTDDRSLVLALADWHTHGGALSFDALTVGEADSPPRPLALPRHPLRPDHHWYTPGVPRRRTSDHDTAHPLLGSKVDLAGGAQEWFSTELSSEQPWYIDQHRLSDVPVLPGAAMIEWATAAARSVFGGGHAWVLDDVRFTTALPLPQGRTAEAQVVVDPQTRSIECFARDDVDGPWVQRARVASARQAAPAAETTRPVSDLVRGQVEQNVAELYSRFSASGIDYGPAFRGLKQVWRNEHEALGRITVDTTGHPDEHAYLTHPVVLDSCFHVALLFITDTSRPYVPVAATSVRVYGRLPADVWSHARLTEVSDTGDHVVDLRLLTAEGATVAAIEGLSLRPLPDGALFPDTPPLRRYVIEWQPVAVPVSPADPDGTWLILSPDADIAKVWQSELHAANLTAAALVTDGEDRAAVDEMVTRLQSETDSLSGVIVHGGPQTSTDDGDAFEELARRTVIPLQRIMATFAATRPTIVVCSTNGVALPGHTPCLAQGALTGLTNALIAEYPDSRVVQVDRDGDDAPAGPLEVLAHVTSATGSSRLAVRDGQWTQARLTTERRPRTKFVPRADATYIVTGGWGALGRVAAVRLASAGARRLVLLGRHAPEPVPAWITDVRAQGVEILLREVDVSDDAAVGALISEVAGDEKLPLRGIVHAAGSTDDAPLVDLDWDRFEQVLSPKTRGAWNLHQHTRHMHLDFFVMFSSLASLIGSAGQANYILANTFLDSLAAVRAHEGLTATSLNWGPWTEGGMAVNGGVLARLRESGLHGITDAEGAAALSHVIADGAVQVGLAKVDWERYAEATARKTPHTLLADLSPRFEDTTWAATPTVVSDLALADPAAAEAELIELLLREATVLLGLGASDREELRPGFADTRFSTLGLDSLMAVRLRDRLVSELSVDLPVEVLVDGSTVSEVAQRLCRQIAVRGVVGGEDDDRDSADVEVIRL